MAIMSHLYGEQNMTNEYFKAANEVMELADHCKDTEVANILKAGSSRIFELAKENGYILKQASCELPEETAEEVFTGTE